SAYTGARERGGRDRRPQQRRDCQAAATAGCGAVAGEQGGETEVRGAEPRTRQDLPARHGESDWGGAAAAGRTVEEAERQVSHPPLRPWESAIIPRFTAPPVGMGNREWGIGGGRPLHTAPHRVFFTAASPRFIIPHSHDSPFPIADSHGGGRGRQKEPPGGIPGGDTAT